MANVSNDGTYQCANKGCSCKVADDETHFKTATGIFCCEECAEGKGCNHSGCDCAAKTPS